MTIPYLVFGTVGVLALVSLVFGVVNIISLVRVSSKLNTLDEELEKKASELDTLRKRGLTGNDRSAVESIDGMAAGSEGEETHKHLDTSQIQIVRNVRGAFDGNREPQLEDSIVDVNVGKDDHGTHGATQEEPEEHADTPTAEPPSSPPPQSEAVSEAPMPQPGTAKDATPQPPPVVEPDEPPQPVQTAEGHMEQPQPLAGESPLQQLSTQYGEPGQVPPNEQSPVPPSSQPPEEQPEAEEEAEVLDVVSDQEPQERGDESAPTIIVYSPQKKDADFERVSQELREKWPASAPGRIVLDFSNVIFLYPQELSYLEQMETYARGHNVELSFTHCDTELRAILSQHPSLGQHVED